MARLKILLWHIWFWNGISSEKKILCFKKKRKMLESVVGVNTTNVGYCLHQKDTKIFNV